MTCRQSTITSINEDWFSLDDELAKKRAFIAKIIRTLAEKVRVKKGVVVSWPKISFFPPGEDECGRRREDGKICRKF